MLDEDEESDDVSLGGDAFSFDDSDDGDFDLGEDNDGDEYDSFDLGDDSYGDED